VNQLDSECKSPPRPSDENVLLLHAGGGWLALTEVQWRDATRRAAELLALVPSSPRQPAADAVGSPIVDAERASEVTGVPPAWWLAQARAGKVPYFRLGKYVRFSLQEVLDHARKCATPELAGVQRGAMKGESIDASHSRDGRPPTSRRRLLRKSRRVRNVRPNATHRQVIAAMRREGGGSVRVPSNPLGSGAPLSAHAIDGES
jgi:hypothetical protein